MLFKSIMRFKLFTIVVPLTITLLTFIIMYRFDVEFLGENNDYYTTSVADIEHGGSTIADYKISEDGVYSFRYRLGGKLDYPYADFNILKRDYSLIDFSKHDSINLNIRSSYSNLLIFRAYSFIDGISVTNDYMSYLPLEIELPVGNNFKDIEFSFDDLEVPLWWYLENNIKSSEKFNHSLKSIVHFQISNHNSMELNIDDLVEIKKINMSCSLIMVLVRLLLLLVIYFSSFFLIYYVRKRIIRDRREKSISYHSLNINNEVDTDSRIEKFIGSNYTNSQLSLTLISSELELSVKHISHYINSKFKLSFPNYLNTIRVTEAKKILINTDIKILDIAMSVGYNSVGHFNRIFKNMENCTPREYRQIYSH